MSIAHDALDFPCRRAKLRCAPFGDGLVSRPRLTVALDRSLRVPRTLVVAPAGFGKTTLLAEWAGQQTISVAWLTVDAEDRELARFAAYFGAALERVAPEVAGRLLALALNPPAPSANLGSAFADTLLDLTHDIVVIVDDAHLAVSPDVLQLLRGFLQLAPPRVHLILGTRSDPALPISQLRVRGHLHELRAGDLCFTDDEVRSLLAQTDAAGHDPELIAELQQQTAGWIAALRLATLVRTPGSDPGHLAGRLAADEHLMAMLLDEVLAQQSAATQDFLLHTALVDRMCPALVDALLDQRAANDSGVTLAGLLRQGLFIAAEAEDGVWFRYHPIFHRLLRHQAEHRLTPDDLARAHARAGAWFADNGWHGEAIRHRLLSGDAAGAATLLDQLVSPLLAREDWRRLDSWLGLLPDALINTRPVLLLARAWISHFSGRLVPVRAVTAEVERLLTILEVDTDVRQALMAECDVLALASMHPIDADPATAVACARAVVARVPPDHRLPYGLAIFSLGCALQSCGQTAEATQMLAAAVARDEERVDVGLTRALIGLVFVHRQAGNLDMSAAVARQTLALAEREGLPVARGWAHRALGWVAYEHDDLDEARAHFAAIMTDHRRVHLTCVSEASLGLALIAQARGAEAEADSALQRLQAIVLEANALENLPWLRGCEAQLALLRGQLDFASNWLRAEGAAIADSTLHAAAHPYLVGIKTRLAEGVVESLEQARHDLAHIRAFAEERHFVSALVEILALEALVLDAQGRQPEALATLARSLELGRPGGFARTYHDLGPRLATLRAHLERAHSPVNMSPTLPSTTELVPGAMMLDVLTLREAEVLQALGRQLSYREIGMELFISLETVKTHASNIYGKLGVASRREAVSRANALGWTRQD